MKIAIIGFSGSGKSTLAQKLGEHYGADVLHLDSVHWLPGWEERPREEEVDIVTAFLDARESWVIDGNYRKVCFDRRMEEADRIIILNFSRISRLFRVLKRYRTYKGRTRESIGEGCPERINGEFLSWVLFKGCTRAHKKQHRELAARYGEKVTFIRNQRQLSKFEKELGLPSGFRLEEEA